MTISRFFVCVSVLIHSIASQCPVLTPSSCDDDDESMCRSHNDCYNGQLCCFVNCVNVCVDPVRIVVKPRDTTVKPSMTTFKPPTTPYIPETKGACSRQSDCGRSQCCTNETPKAKTGICQDRKRIAYRCHNPRKRGVYHVWCPGPAGIIHPDLCPCGCGDFCAIGIRNPEPDTHGGYFGICSFG